LRRVGSGSNIRWVTERAELPETPFDTLAQTPEEAGRRFERCVETYLRACLRPLGHDVTIDRLAGAGDQGRDIVVRARRGPLRLFGLELAPAADDSLSVGIQCKQARTGSIDGDGLIGSVQKASKFCFTHTLLVTNRTISPRVHLECDAIVTQTGGLFHVVNGWQLCQHMTVDGGPTDPPPSAETPPLAVAYQNGVETTRRTDATGADITTQDVDLVVAVRNRSANLVPLAMVLETDTTWSIVEETVPTTGGEIRASLGPFETAVWRLVVRRDIGRGIESLIVRCAEQAFTQRICIDGYRLGMPLLPPLFGADHHRSLGELQDVLNDDSEGRTVFLSGPAGSGKTRVLQEIERRFAAGSRPMIFCQVRPHQSMADLIGAIAGATEIPDDNPIDFDALLETLSRTFHNTIIVFDDLHNASESVVDIASRFIIEDSRPPTGVKIVFCGRDDDSYINASYASLLAAAPAPEAGEPRTCIRMTRFKASDARRFIRSICPNLPAAAAERVFEIGDRLPFNIIATFETLLDRGICQIYSDRSVGMVDLARFEADGALPGCLETILTDRLESLGSLESGALMVRVLRAAAYKGVEINRVWLEGILARHRADTAFDVLSDRNFVMELGGRQLFAHENIQRHLRNGLSDLDAAERARVAELALAPPDGSGLPSLQRGELLFWAGDIKAADPILRPVVERLVDMENLSASHLRDDCLDIRASLLDFAAREGLGDDTMAELNLALTQLSLHYRSPAQCIRDAELALERLSRNRSRRRSQVLRERPIKQFQAHALINAGDLLHASGLMKELETESPLFPETRREMEVRFDLNNRLFDIHMKWNHEVAARNYASLASQTIDRMIDMWPDDGDRVRYLHCLQDDCFARLDMQVSPKKAYDRLAASIDAWSGVAPDRNVAHNRNSLQSARLMLSRDSSTDYADLLKDAERQYQEAWALKAPGVLIRAVLTLATIGVLMAEDDAEAVATRVDVGIDLSLRHGYHTYLWQLYNLKAIHALGRGASKKAIDESFRTMATIMGRQSLFFLGTLPVCFPNGLGLSNYFRWITESHAGGSRSAHVERKLVGLLTQLVFYDRRRPGGHANVEEMAESLLRTGSIYRNWPTPRGPGPLRDPRTGYWLPLH